MRILSLICRRGRALRRLLDQQDEILDRQDEIMLRQEDIMAAVDNLEAATVKLTDSVDKAIEKLGEGSGGVDEARVQAAADKVASEADRLDAATGEPVPPVVIP